MRRLCDFVHVRNFRWLGTTCFLYRLLCFRAALVEPGIVFLSVHWIETVVLHVDYGKLAAKALRLEMSFESFLGQALSLDSGSLAVQLHRHPVVLCLDFDSFIPPVCLVEGHLWPESLNHFSVRKVEQPFWLDTVPQMRGALSLGTGEPTSHVGDWRC